VLRQKLMEGDEDSQEFRAIAESPRSALREHIARLRCKVRGYPIDPGRRLRENRGKRFHRVTPFRVLLDSAWHASVMGIPLKGVPDQDVDKDANANRQHENGELLDL